MPFQDLLKQALHQNQITINDAIFPQFIHYLELLQQWNRAFNLTSIKDEKEMVLLHIIDSLLIAPYCTGQQLLDVGSGAGLPGIPLALFFPEKNMTLLDSNGKKTRFLTQVVYELKLKNVQVIQSRAENFKTDICFDNILSRAFASLKLMLESTRHLLCQTGEFLAMKGVYPQQEIQEISPDFTVSGTRRLKISGLNAERHLICIRLKE